MLKSSKSILLSAFVKDRNDPETAFKYQGLLRITRKARIVSQFSANLFGVATKIAPLCILTTGIKIEIESKHLIADAALNYRRNQIPCCRSKSGIKTSLISQRTN